MIRPSSRLLGAVFIAGAFASLSYSQNLLLSYDFNEAAPVYSSAGSVKAKLKGTGKLQRAGDPGSGVSGRPEDRAWDASANTIQAFDPEAKTANSAALIHDKDENAIDNLKAFTFVIWFQADQPLSNAANRLFFNADATQPTAGFAVRAVSRASGSRRSHALEFAPGNDGEKTKAIVSQYFAPGTGYAKVGEWVFVAITWNGGRVDFYVGDRNSAVKPAGSGVFQGPMGDEKQPLIIGNMRGSARGLDGKIDNFRLYDGALSPAALESLRAADVAGTPAR